LNDFDISDFVLNKDKTLNKYELISVSNHYGGLSGGHYTAYAKVNGKWYDFDDSSTNEINEDSVITKSAYLLFFKRKSE
jgi:ubiquitin C-terminal hydrolase